MYLTSVSPPPPPPVLKALASPDFGCYNKIPRRLSKELPIVLAPTENRKFPSVTCIDYVLK